ARENGSNTVVAVARTYLIGYARGPACEHRALRHEATHSRARARPGPRRRVHAAHLVAHAGARGRARARGARRPPARDPRQSHRARRSAVRRAEPARAPPERRVGAAFLRRSARALYGERLLPAAVH